MGETLALFSFGPGGWGAALATGAFVTISLALATVPVGLSLGLGVAITARSKNVWARRFATLFTTIFRGLPELLTLFIVYYGGAILLRKALAPFGYGDVQIDAFLAGVIALGLVLAAFSSEVWLGALNSIAAGQREAASALGLTRAQAFLLVVFPQLMRVALPGLSNNWLALLKDTSLVSTIALVDLMRQTNLAVGATKQPLPFYLLACLIYLVFSMISGGVFGALERRANRGSARIPATGGR
jgi:polar amino acid transport system permease protein